MLDLIRNETAIAEPLRFDYSQVDEAHREQVMDAAVDIRRRTQQAQDDLVAAGQRLNEVKDFLPHGQFEKWLGTEFNLSVRMAQNLMNVARRFDGKNETVSLLNSSVLYMLASPSVPDVAVEQVVSEAQTSGASPTKARVREIIARHKPANTMAAVVPISRVVGKCRVCHRPLTDPSSVNEACGPTCAAKLAAGVEPDDDERGPFEPGVAVVGNGPLEDDDAPTLPADLVALGCRLELDAGFYRVRYGSHSSEYASYEGAVAWCRRITGTDAANQQGTRQERIAGLLTLYRQTLESLDEYGAITGDFTGPLPLRRSLEPMITKLEANARG